MSWAGVSAETIYILAELYNFNILRNMRYSEQQQRHLFELIPNRLIFSAVFGGDNVRGRGRCLGSYYPLAVSSCKFTLLTPSTQLGEMRRRHLPMSHDRGEPMLSIITNISLNQLLKYGDNRYQNCFPILVNNF